MRVVPPWCWVTCPGASSDPVCFVTDSLRVCEDEDNHAVIHSARDALKLIQNTFLPAVCSWVQVRSPRAGVPGQSRGHGVCGGGRWGCGEGCVPLGPGRSPRAGAESGQSRGHGVCRGGRWGCGEGALAGLNDAPPFWQLFTRAGIHGGHLEAAIDLKTELERALRRSGELDIKPEEGRWREVSAASRLGRGDSKETSSWSCFLSQQESLGLGSILVPALLGAPFLKWKLWPGGPESTAQASPWMRAGTGSRAGGHGRAVGGGRRF